MTYNFNQGYFGNLRINLDPIIFFAYYFSQNEEMLFDYVYLGINVPTYLKLCANLDHACNTPKQKTQERCQKIQKRWENNPT